MNDAKGKNQTLEKKKKKLLLKKEKEEKQKSKDKKEHNFFNPQKIDKEKNKTNNNNNKTNNDKEIISHDYNKKKSLDEYNKEIAQKKQKEELLKKRRNRLDKNTVILFLIVYFVAIIIFIKVMGTMMGCLTSLGIIIIILLSLFLKHIRHNKIMRVITNLFTIAFLLGCIAALCGVVYFAYIIVIEAPDWNPKELTEKETTVFYDASGDNLIYELATEKRENIKFNDVSENLINAIISVEDSRFFKHNGFDPLRFFKASLGQLAGNSSAGGASTLSMQLIKNSFTDKDVAGMNKAGIKRKFTDIYLAVFKLEKQYSKEAIFEYYINNHFLGRNSYGVQQAAQTYFRKDASELTLAEASTIAGMFQSPVLLDPFKYPEKATKRRNEVLDLMHTHGYITEEQRDTAKAIPIQSLLATNSNSSVQKFQLYINTVIQELLDKGYDPYNTSLKVYTNIDVKKQQGLEDIFFGKTFKWENDKVQSGMAAVDVWTGKIVAIAGGRDGGALTLNRAADSKQQIGSTAKPVFDYAPAMEYLGYSTYTLINDAPYSYSSGQPIRNSDRKYMGNITVRTAIAQSRNVPALKTFQKVKNSDIYNFVTSLGIEPETTGNSTYLHEAHSIGSFNGATPLQMTAAYAAFANGGIYYKPYTVSKIVYRDTGEEIDFKPEGTRVMSSSTAFMITYCLRTAVTDGLSNGADLKGVNVAAKTGTTNWSSADAKALQLPSYAVHDAWIVGYDPDTALGMWYGYDEIEKGTQYFLKSASSGFKVNVQTERNRLYQAAEKVIFTSNGKEFKVPDTVVKVAIEKGTDPARLASSGTPKSKITYEYFKVGTEPTEISAKYSRLSNVTNLKATFNSNSVNLTWSAASRGKDYDEGYGDIVYKIYFNDKYLGFTKDTNYKVNNQSNYIGTYKVVTSYENYSEMDSTGATANITASQTDLATYTAELVIESTSYKIGDPFNECLKKGVVSNQCVILKRDGVLIENGYTVEVSITDLDGEAVDFTTDHADTYKFKFQIKYNGAVRVTKNVTITVTE